MDGAVALAQVDDLPPAVPQDLDLDVARARDQLLDVQLRVAEGGLGFYRGGGEGFREGGGRVRNSHPPAAAARDGLYHYRVPDLVRDVQRVVFRFDGAVAARDEGDAGLGYYPAGRGLIAHVGYRFVRRADKRKVGGLACLGEVGVFREEAVAGVHGLGVRNFRGGDYARDVEVRLGGLRRADAIGLVGEADVEALRVGLAVYGHRLDAHLATGADDADGDFASVGYEYFVEQSRFTFIQITPA